MSDNKIGTLLLGATLYAFLTIFNTASAIELLSYKDSNTGTTVISRSAVEGAWNSNTATCLKNGATLLGVNKAFKAAGFGYRDCSTSKAAKRIQKATGKKVVVFKLAELPEDMIKEILKK